MIMISNMVCLTTLTNGHHHYGHPWFLVQKLLVKIGALNSSLGSADGADKGL